MIEGAFLMGVAVFVIAMDRYRKQESNRWTYFIMGMFFAFGSADFIRAFAHWMN
jgi:cytochrome c biogenesis protein CcdA